MLTNAVAVIQISDNFKKYFAVPTANIKVLFAIPHARCHIHTISIHCDKYEHSPSTNVKDAIIKTDLKDICY